VSELDTAANVGSIKLPYPGRYTGASPWFGTTVTATPDGRYLITATTSGSLVRWHLDQQSWKDVACTTAARDLTADEWRAYVGTTPPDTLACNRL
jgi:hypothetical protein